MRFLNRSAGRLSRHRRSKVASVVILLVGLMMTGGLYAVFAPAQAGPASTDDELVAQGKDLFLISCASCHGANGEGVPTQNGNWMGPPLAGVGEAAADFQLGTGRMPMANPGGQAPRKPTTLTEEEIAALVAYVGSLGPGPAIPGSDLYDVEQGDPVRGMQIFLTNCSACHNFEGSGGAMPDGGEAVNLHEKGVEPKYIYEAMLTGPQTMDVFSDGNIPPEDKRDIVAFITTVGDSEKIPAYGGFGLGGLGPVSEGMFAWVLGLGSLVGFAVWIAAHTTRSKKEQA